MRKFTGKSKGRRGVLAALVLGAFMAVATTSPAWASNQFTIKSQATNVRYWTDNGNGGDGYVHGSSLCTPSICNDQIVTITSPDHNITFGDNTVVCNGFNGEYWPFTVHSLDCGAYQGDAVRTLEFANVAGDPCASGISNTFVENNGCTATGHQWVRHNASYVNVYQSDNSGSGQVACQGTGDGAKLLIQSFVSDGTCSWSVQAGT